MKRRPALREYKLTQRGRQAEAQGLHTTQYFCPSCDQEIGRSAAICPHCRTDLISQTPIVKSQKFKTPLLSTLRDSIGGLVIGLGVALAVFLIGLVAYGGDAQAGSLVALAGIAIAVVFAGVTLSINGFAVALPTLAGSILMLAIHGWRY
ncbi:MAG TPA: hypothetical protein VG815_04520 [Chloroflexota bacterium]|nr:hypothetical protein [Chloroflexota bacterium]